jgi:hypothetical protein
MTQPQPLSTFKDLLLQSGDIQKLIAGEYGPESDAAIGRFRSGDDSDLWDLIENYKYETFGKLVKRIRARGSEPFNVEIWSLGPVFWIRANEFDDIGYFASRQDVIACAVATFLI